MLSGSSNLAGQAGFDLLDPDLAQDVEASLGEALAGGAVFPGAAREPLGLFRDALAGSIRDIEAHPRGVLLQRFLRDGPLDGTEKGDRAVIERRLTDEETARAISFIAGHMVRSFQGSLAEILSLAPCVRLLHALRGRGRIPSSSRLYVGDAVTARAAGTAGYRKAADIHVLSFPPSDLPADPAFLVGVVEVKSYVQSRRRFRAQLDRHLERAASGLCIQGSALNSARVRIGTEDGEPAVRVAIEPSRWKLPRSFHWEKRFLVVDPPKPPNEADTILATGSDEFRIILRWSQEALAAAAYDMTFWYMERIGEVIYRTGVPVAWSPMSPPAAGRNAAKEMLYYSILRCRNKGEEDRAIALYNTYGFGYALGMNFRNQAGRREMLWPEHLDEIAAKGRTEDGWRIVGLPAPGKRPPRA